jgi:hypothetical protein
VAFHDSGAPGVAAAIAEAFPPGLRLGRARQAWSILAAQKR